MNLHHVLAELATKRPVFHNEADFQHALAWEIREQYPEAKIRLETKVHGADTKVYLDILVQNEDQRYAIELKYKTRTLTYMAGDEEIRINNQGAQDTGRYDVLKDIQRLEQMVAADVVDKGYLIFLTNDASYYSDPGIEKYTVDRDFRIHEGRLVSGTLAWAEQTGAGTMKGREEPIRLEGEYRLRWARYSQIGESPSGEFRYLCLPVHGIARREVLQHQTNITVEQPDQPVAISSSENPNAWFSTFVQEGNIPTSQADLRDQLAKHLREMGYNVIVNRPFGANKVDIWAEKGGAYLAIEVRYKTALLQTVYRERDLHLKNQGAHDISRYDFVRDIEKLERVIRARPDVTGYALLITNDPLYWKHPRKQESVDKDFHLYEGRLLTGTCKWGELASAGTTAGREETIHLSGAYPLSWQPYLELGTGKNEIFQYLIVEVNELMATEK